MTQIEEKLYLQKVFDAIDEVYNLHNHKKTSTYEERLRASFNKLTVPDWYNPDYTCINSLRKAKSHGQVPRTKRFDTKTDNDASISTSNNSCNLSNGSNRHRSTSQSWSERPPIRHNSTASSCDANGSTVINGRHLGNSHDTSTYTSGLQRVVQSSTWYKPKALADNKVNGSTTNGHSIEPPKPPPRYSKLNQEHINSTESSDLSSTSKIINSDLVSNGNIRYSIEQRTMSQIPISTEQNDNESSSLNTSLDVSSDGNLTIIQKLTPSRPIDLPSNPSNIINTPHSNKTINQLFTTNMIRTDSTKSISSDSESKTSTVVPSSASSDKNLLGTDSSSYVSVNDQCVSTSSYHTAVATDDKSSLSMNGYETPTPKLDNEILSSHSSTTDLSHVETSESHIEADLAIAAISKEEQKPAIIPSVNVGMEKSPLSLLSSTSSNTPTSSLNDNSPSTESRPLENTNWYDDGSIETCIDQTPAPFSSAELRELSHDEILHGVDLNGVGDEFFLFSPRNTTDDEPSSSLSDDRHEQELEQILNPTQIAQSIYTKENKTDDDFTLSDEFHCSTTADPFDFKSKNSSIMITNLDDMLADDDDDINNDDDDDDDDEDDDQNLFKDKSTYLLNTSYRRPIQEDILYEVEHENSFSDHSQYTSSMVMADDNTSIKIDPNMDYLTSTKESKVDADQSAVTQVLSEEKLLQSTETHSSLNPTRNDQNTLPIYILPPLYPTTEKSSALHVNTSTNSSLYQSGSYSHPYDNLTSPSSYTSKIRHRHICVGSYYDNKTTTVAIHPNHTLYILGSAPVSPLSRTSASETHYHSPISYGNLTFNALRRVNPFLETNTMLSNYDYQRSPSLYRDDYQRTTYYQPITPIQSTIQTAAESSLPPLFSTPLETQTSSRTVEQYEVPHIPSETVPTTAVSSESQFFTSLSQSEVPLMRPKTSRGRTSEIPPPPLVPPPPPPAAPAPAPRIASIEKDQTQRGSQESDVSSTINDDLQFIRGTIDRVFDHHGGSSTSESSTLYEEISEDNNDDNHLLSSSSSTKTLSKNNDQYPAVEAVQRFYDTKASSDSEKKNPIKQNVDLRDVPISNHSSASNKLYARSHPRNTKKKNFSNSTDNEQASSEEVDDTLNDIEDDDYQDDKLRRQATNNSSHTSSEESPVNSSNSQVKTKKASQETQTLQRKEKYTVTTQSQSGSQTTLQSYETARSSVPPIDIVTQMVIERTDDIDDGRIGEISGDMVIFYDDIEIVENSSNISTTESDSVSSISKSQSNSKSYELVPPPVPARALKPVHLLDNQKAPSSTKQNKTNSAPPPAQPIPAPLQTPSSSKVNRVYELEKAGIRKKFDVNSVNTMINRADYYMGPIATHRHPSARHFVGKLNNDETSARNSIDASTNIIAKSSPPSQPTTNMVKSKTLPLQAVNTNGYVVNNNQPTTPTRTSLLNSHMLTTFPSDINVKYRSVVSDTNELVKQIRNSLSRTSLHDTNLSSPLSLSTKDLRTFVSSTYSPNDENMIDNDGIIHKRHQSIIDDDDDQGFKRQARLSKSFHNVSEYSSIDQYPKKDNTFTPRAQPSKSVENNLNQVPQTQKRHSQIPANFPSIVPSTSFSALPHSDDNARQLSMKWYTGQVNENSEICFNASHGDSEDLLYTYISTHSHMEMQLLLARLQESSDIRIHAALDDIRSRVVQFDASKSPGDVHTFMRYLESRLRDISNKTLSITQLNHTNDQRRLSNGTTGTNGYHIQKQRPSDATSIKSRTNSILTEDNRDSSSPRQLGRQHLRTSSTKTGGGINGHQHPPPPPRRASQSSVNQENPAVFDDMLNTVLGLPKKGVTNLPATNPSSQSREKPTPLAQTQISTNTTTAMNKSGQDVGKRLFESGIYKDPRLIYDGPRKTEKEEQPLETSV